MKEVLLKKKTTAIMLVIILVAAVAITVTRMPKPNNSTNTGVTSSHYVEIDYKPVNLFFRPQNVCNARYEVVHNYTYIVLEVTITNLGYKQVNVSATVSEDFRLTINVLDYSINYSALDYPTWMCNTSSSSLEFITFTSLLHSGVLLDSNETSGAVVFQLDPWIWDHSYALAFSGASLSPANCTIKLV